MVVALAFRVAAVGFLVLSVVNYPLAAYSIRPLNNRRMGRSTGTFRRTHYVKFGIYDLLFCANLNNPNVDGGGDSSIGENKLATKGFFNMALEGAVRQVTGETEYKLGLLGVNGEKNSTYKYQFGDLTRAVLGEFGILTNVNATATPTLKDLERSVLTELRIPLDEKDLPLDVMEHFFAQLDTKQRINLILRGCQCAAEAVVLWGFITNLCTICSASLAWATALMTAPTWPLLPICIERDLWRTFVAKFTGFHLVLSPLFLITQAIGTLVGFRRFHSFVHHLSTSRWITDGPWREYESPVLYRAIAVISAFFMTNIVLSFMMAGTAFASISLSLRVLSLVVKSIRFPF